MALTQDILATYRRPGRVFARLMDDEAREDKALLYVLVAGVILFIAQSPFQARQAFLDPSVPLEARLYWSGFFLIFVLPLPLYLVAALSHIIARILGGQGTWLRARLALFWSVLASAPIVLLMGLVAGMLGGGVRLQAVAAIWLAVFGWFWISGLWQAEWRDAKRSA